MSGFGEGSRVRHAHLHGSETPEVDLSRVHAVHTAHRNMQTYGVCV